MAENKPLHHIKEIMMARESDIHAQDTSILSMQGDGFAIYQLKHSDEVTDIRFMDMEYLSRKGITVQRSNYDQIYAAPMAFEAGKDTQDHLNDLYFRFNCDHPQDFRGHSLSVSDIVALKRDGQVSCHYVDRWGFKEIPGFLQRENPLRSAEMAMEDDYGMIDGIINNGRSEAVKEKPSVMEQLKSAKPKQQRKSVKKRTEKGKER